ncbi:MAG: type I restriction endonuclease subunit R [Rhodospirillaceae bacterium]|nr:MAG: type I restriction endonuclease subunit R [Rhodospirillaceae bacterium]
MSFPRYPAYKDSGVEWLGDVPGQWEVVPLKYISTHNDDVLVESTDPNNEITYVDISSVDGVNGIATKETMSFSAAPSRARRRVRHGDVIVSTVRTYLKAIAVVRDPEDSLIVSTGFAVIRPRDELTPNYLGFLVFASYFVEQIIVRSKGVSYPAINAGELVAISVPLPSPPEQTAIAAFLDRETAKIDGLVAEQRRLIDLLKEKRHTVISHAVTKGLNPDAPMKPSGIEWLGDVPEHWELRKLSQLFRAGKGKNGQKLTKEYCAANEGEYPVYSGQTENEGVMGTWDQFEFDFEDTGVLFSTTVGAKAMNLQQLFGRFSLSQNCMIIWPTSSRCITRFFFYHLQPLFRYQRAMIPDHMQASFRVEDLYGYFIALPPSEEQTAIAAFLDRETAKLDELIDEAQRAVDLLQERRTALISAAVTGKIDVRGLADMEAA